MKTNEFIEEMHSLGYETTNLERSIIVNDDNGFFLVDVSKERFGVFSTEFAGFYGLDIYSRSYLLDRLVIYAKTPVNEREDEKRYYLKLKGFDGEQPYLCAYDFWNAWILIEKDSFTHGDEFYFKFTEENIKNLPEELKAHNWEQIEVESEE